MFADAALFTDYGGVFARNFSDFDARRLYWDVGAALRVFTSSKFFIRIGAAYGFDIGHWQLVVSGDSG